MIGTLVLVPGVQGRWEYMRRAIEALSAHFQVLTFSLREDQPVTMETFTSQITSALEGAGVRRATICGISFGGNVALRFAATNPDRVEALVLASTPGPGWRLRPRHELYARKPLLFGPLFFVESPWRLRGELVAALPDKRALIKLTREVMHTIATAPVSLTGMAARAQLLSTMDVPADCARITAPTLVITGEPSLDHVVPAKGSSEYAHLIAGARAVVLERTGHWGSITRAQAFSDLVTEFVMSHLDKDLRSNDVPGCAKASVGTGRERVDAASRD
jgi:3-oxoadipate enol-lactonase